jgi:hypothetical protein
VRQLKSLDDILVAYGEEVEALAVAPRYREPVKALTCYKGIKHLFALTMSLAFHPDLGQSQSYVC